MISFMSQGSLPEMDLSEYHWPIVNVNRLIYFIHITNQNFRQVYPKPSETTRLYYT